MKKAAAVALLVVLGLSLPVPISVAQSRNRPVYVIWKDPGAMSSRNLYYGPGAASLAPAPPFRFIEEDTSATTPKFKVKDARNVEWSVKLGIESQSETVATRLVWAAGYFAGRVLLLSASQDRQLQATFARFRIFRCER